MKVVTGPDGALWFSMLGRNTIGRMTTLGVLTERTLPPSCMPLGLAVGADAALWFTCLGGNTIGRLTLAGTISTYRVPTPDSGPTHITPGADGALWFTQQKTRTVGRLTPDGIITEHPAGPGAFPHGITATSSGIWFTDSEYIGHIRLPAGPP